MYAYSGIVDTGTVGSYTVDYRKVDANGNTGYASRTVIVQDSSIPIPTIIYEPTSPTSGNVVASITFNKSGVNITNI
ncbi:MAG: DUF5011 domain-containing protein [Candidatus Peribacteria bacterium]|nr:DUF5011 domain-containing protein [Candidatus Peribacteria bacterium]